MVHRRARRGHLDALCGCVLAAIRTSWASRSHSTIVSSRDRRDAHRIPLSRLWNHDGTTADSRRLDLSRSHRSGSEPERRRLFRVRPAQAGRLAASRHRPMPCARAAEIARLDPASHPMYTATLARSAAAHTQRSPVDAPAAVCAPPALLLLIACANVATLLLARSVAGLVKRQSASHSVQGGDTWRSATSPKRLPYPSSVPQLVVALSVVLVRVIVVAGSEYMPAADELVDRLESGRVRPRDGVRR